MTDTKITRPVLELLTWWPQSAPPDSDTTVLSAHPPEAASEPVWPGYLCSEADDWRSAEGMPMPAPAHWADMPAGPLLLPVTTAAANLLQVAQQLIAHAANQGLVLTIEQHPLQPLAQGHYETVARVREVRR